MLSIVRMMKINELYILWLTSYDNYKGLPKFGDAETTRCSSSDFEKYVGMNMLEYSENHGKYIYRSKNRWYKYSLVEKKGWMKLKVMDVFIEKSIADSIKKELIKCSDMMNRIEYMLNNN